MTKKLENLFYYIILSLPITFILGSALINLAVILLNLIFITHAYYNKNYNFFEKHKIYFFLILAFIIYQIINNLINNNHNNLKSISYIRFLLIPILMKYFFCKMNIDFKKLSKFYIIVFIFLICDLIFQYILNFNILNFKPGLYNIDNDLYERYAGVFDQELIMGGFLGSLGFLSIIFYFEFNKLNKYLFYFFLIVLFFSILITGERTSTLGCLLSIFFIFIFCKKHRKFLILTSLLIIFLTAILIPSNKQLKLRYMDYPMRVLGVETHFDQNAQTLNVRIKKISSQGIKISESIDNFFKNSSWGLHYRTAFAMFMDKPLNGHGFKQYRIVCANYSYLFKSDNLSKNVVEKNGCSTHPHNYILEILSEQGLIGIAIFFSIILYCLNDIFKNDQNKIYKLMILSLLLSYLFPFKPSGSIISTWYSSIFWFMLGFMHIKEKIKNL